MAEKKKTLSKEVLNDFIDKALANHLQNYIEGNVKKNLILKHNKFTSIANDKIEKKNQRDLTKLFGEALALLPPKKKKPSLLQKYKTRLKMNEEAPTNAMGNSSSTQGPIQTFDPILFLKKRKKAQNKSKEG